MSNETFKTITEDEVQVWCNMPMTDATLTRLTDILNGEYTVDKAREDILSFRHPVDTDLTKLKTDI